MGENIKWLPVVGFEDCYAVSNTGDIESLSREVYNGKGYYLKKALILKQKVDKNGYKIVQLNCNGKVKDKKVHRLVGEAFIPNPDKLPQINHKNEVKDDNGVDNLEWVTVKFNTNYGTRNVRVGEKQSIPVYQYDLDGTFIKKWKSLRSAKKKGYSSGKISLVINGKRNTHKKCKWSKTPLNTRILVNAIMCPDGTIMQSTDRYDYRTHTTIDSWKRVWKSNGKEVSDEAYNKLSFEELSNKTKLVIHETRNSMIDGGTHYLRRGGVYTEMSIYEDDPFEVIRRFFCRGGRGKEGDEPITWTPLFRMSNDWLQATIEYTPDNYYNKFYQMEIDYRKERGITIKN